MGAPVTDILTYIAAFVLAWAFVNELYNVYP